MAIIFILIIALAIDIIFSEPPDTWHPVAWLGNLISSEVKLAPRSGKFKQFAYGICMVLITLALVVTTIYCLLIYLRDFNIAMYVIIAGILLKFSFSLRKLGQAVNAVRTLIAKNELKQARVSLKALVSRNTSELRRKQMISAAVESAAENICDSFVAPLFYFSFLGVAGAVAYRVINTFDTMIGYHGPWEYLGKCAAKLDDVANFIPARVTALLIILAAIICRKNIWQAWHIMLRDHKKTESPNAGWTMSAMAGALEVQLEKAGHYKLGDNHIALSLDTIHASRQIIMVTAIIWCSIFILAEVIRYVAS